MGYSLGRGAALQTDIRHPEVAKRLELVSTPFRRSAFHPQILAQHGRGHGQGLRLVGSGRRDQATGADRGDIFASPALASVALPFLDGPRKEGLAEQG
jgi:pimeloyl-ACP methyl ester carboxylesterase